MVECCLKFLYSSIHCLYFQAVANGHRNVAKHLLEKTDKTALTVTDHKVGPPMCISDPLCT